MASAEQLFAFAMLGSIMLGFIYGGGPRMPDPFGNADREASAELGREEAGWGPAVQGTGACLVGGAAVGLLAAVPTFGLGTWAIGSIAAAGCVAALGVFGTVTGENPFEAIPIVGEIAKFAALIVSMIGAVVGLMLYGLADPEAPDWAKVAVSGAFVYSIGWRVAHLVRGSTA